MSKLLEKIKRFRMRLSAEVPSLGLSQPLDVVMLFSSVFHEVARRTNARVLQLPERALIECADDTDYHRSRHGYMRYLYAACIPIPANSQIRILAFGINGGGYPADRYICDLASCYLCYPGFLLPESDDELAASVIVTLRELNCFAYFNTSLLIGYSSGQFRGFTREPSKSLWDAIKPRLGDFVAQEPTVHKGLIRGDGEPVIASGAMYKPSFVGFIADEMMRAVQQKEI